MRRLFTTLVALAIALSVNALGVNLAPLAAHNDTCAASYFCVWPLINYDDYSGQGEHRHFSQSSDNWDFWGLENDDDSVKNMEPLRVRVFANSGYVTTKYCVLPSQVEDDIHLDRDDDGDSNLIGVDGSCSGYPSP